MINPQQHVINAILASLPQYKIWADVVPRRLVTPTNYILITSQNLSETSRAKDCYEWIVSLNLDVVNIGTLGYSYADIIANIIQDVIPAMDNLSSGVVRIKNVDLVASNSFYSQTSTNSINRGVLTYDIWCAYQDQPL